MRTNPYYELERINDFQKFKDYSPLVDDYYLVYDAEDIAYSTSSRFAVPYLLDRLEISREALFDKPQGVKSTRVISQSTQHRILFLLSFRMTGLHDASGDLTLVFVVNQEKLQACTEALCGMIRDDWVLSGYGTTILGTGSDSYPLTVQSNGGGYSLSLLPEALPGYQSLFPSLRGMLLCGTLLTALFLCLGILAAFYAYHPIKRIADRLGSEAKKDTLLAIEHSIEKMEAENARSREGLISRSRTIEMQKQQLRGQLISMMLSGVFPSGLERQMELAGLKLPHPLYTVITLSAARESSLDDTGLQETLTALMDERVCAYGYAPHEGRDGIILVNHTDEETLRQLTELLANCFESMEVTVDSQVGKSCRDIRQLPLSRISDSEEARGGDSTRREWEGEARQMEEALAAGAYQNAGISMGRLLGMLADPALPKAQRHCRKILLLNILLKIAEQIHVDISDALIERVIATEDAQRIEESCAAIFSALEKRNQELIGSREQTLSENMQAYIAQHLTDTQLSLGSIAEHFSISGRRAGQIIQSTCGMSYKEYIVTQKIALASRLLTEENMSVSEVSDTICYANAAYFIKVFKEETGYTPGQYKRMHAATNTGRDEA